MGWRAEFPFPWAVVSAESPPPSEALVSYVAAGVFGWTGVVTAAASLALAVRDADPSASPGIRIISNRPFRAVSTPVVGAHPARNLLVTFLP